MSGPFDAFLGALTGRGGSSTPTRSSGPLSNFMHGGPIQALLNHFTQHGESGPDTSGSQIDGVTDTGPDTSGMQFAPIESPNPQGVGALGQLSNPDLSYTPGSTANFSPSPSQMGQGYQAQGYSGGIGSADNYSIPDFSNYSNPGVMDPSEFTSAGGVASFGPSWAEDIIGQSNNVRRGDDHNYAAEN